MQSFDNLWDILHALRGEGGCPWDQEQTQFSLLQFVQDEFFELKDAVSAHDVPNIREELGDLLFLLMHITLISEEKQEFSMDSLLQETADKMIGRHPHVFGEGQAKTSLEVQRHWEQRKQQEAPQRSLSDSLPKSMPPWNKIWLLLRKAGNRGLEPETWRTAENNRLKDQLRHVLLDMYRAKIDPDTLLEEILQDFLAESLQKTPKELR